MWDKACFALFPSWQLQCQVGEEQAGLPQLPGWDRVVWRAGVSQSSMCQLPLSCASACSHSWEALEGSECMEMGCVQDPGN